MSAQHPQILYVGNTHAGQALHGMVNNTEWHVHLPGDVDETLAQYIFYMPDIIVIDSTSNDTFSLQQLQDTLMHLQSVEANPIIIISTNTEAWSTALLSHSALLSPDVSIETLLRTIEHLIVAKTGQCPEMPVLSEPTL